MGRLLAELDELGNRKKSYRYNREGLKIEEQDATGDLINYEYGAGSRLNKVKTPTLEQTISYNSRNRITKTILTLLTPSTTDQPPLATEQLITSYKYDKAGQQIEQTDPQGRTTKYSYDSLGRIKAQIDPVGGKTQVYYDSRDNLIAVLNAQGNIHGFGYDRLNRKISETEPLGQERRQSWDVVGNLVRQTDALGNIKQYTYDGLNRRTKMTVKRPDDTLELTVNYSYNEVGVLTAYSDGQHSVTIKLDALQHKLDESTDYGPFTRQITQTWTKTGQLQGMNTSSGKTTYHYDLAQRLRSIDLPTGGVIGYNRFATGQSSLPIETIDPGGTRVNSHYDSLGQPTELKSYSPGQTIVMKRQMTYDQVRNLITLDSQDRDINFSHDYQYDDLDRLKEAKYSPASKDIYSYDKVHNRISANDQSLQYNNNNQLIDQAGIQYSYNANGQMIRKVTGSGNTMEVTHWRYNAEDRLQSVKRGLGPSALVSDTTLVPFQLLAQYSYDPLGRRISKISHVNEQGTPRSETLTTYYHYNDQGLIGEYDSQGTLKASYNWHPQSPWSTAPLSLTTRRDQATDLETFYYHTDHLGTPQKLTDQTGRIVWSQKQSAFGEMTLQPGNQIINNLRFPGQYYDLETQTHYNYHRDYDPSLGRYLQRDPIGLEGGINVYGYGEQNPERYVDPDGLTRLPPRLPHRPTNPNNSASSGLNDVLIDGFIGTWCNFNLYRENTRIDQKIQDYRSKRTTCETIYVMISWSIGPNGCKFNFKALFEDTPYDPIQPCMIGLQGRGGYTRPSNGCRTFTVRGTKEIFQCCGNE